MLGRRNEVGGSYVSSIIWLLIAAAFVYMVMHVGPAYYDHWDLQDKLQQIARLPRGRNSDSAIMDILMKEVRNRRLEDYISTGNFQISTAETSRVIKLEYERSIEVLPGYKPTVKFSATADQPLL